MHYYLTNTLGMISLRDGSFCRGLWDERTGLVLEHEDSFAIPMGHYIRSTFLLYVHHALGSHQSTKLVCLARSIKKHLSTI